MRILMTVIVLFSLVPALSAEIPRILSMEERAEVVNQWLRERLDTVVPALMKREAIDMWILVAREYNEDPVVRTMLPATWLNARRRTVLIFSINDESVERLAVARYDIGDIFKSAWNKEDQPDQWQRIAEIILERDPQTIAVNRSRDFALADGMTETEFKALSTALPEVHQKRIVSGEKLAVGWLETRIPAEIEAYPTIVRLAHEIIAEGFSNKAIHPGISTTADVEWWFRERIRELKLTTWFHPSVSIQRRKGDQHPGSFSSRENSRVIRRGDLLHVDFGITYLRLNTDTQQHAYVLKPGEADAPEGLRAALTVGNRLQDILLSNFVTGRSGNEILLRSLSQAKEEGIIASIYTHPIGFHGHGAGPTIGLWDQQEGVPGSGDYPLQPNTAYSIELNVTVPVREWERELRIMLEEDALFDGEKVWYIDGRQTELILIH